MRLPWKATWSGNLLAALAPLAGCRTPDGNGAPVFWRPDGVGSERVFSPLHSSLQYALDGTQIRGASTDGYDDKVQLVLDHLREPLRTIENGDGGWRDFVNSELVPIDPRRPGDSLAILPNVFLHTLGGGLLYRKTAEWFEGHGVPLPWLLSGVLAMAVEVLGEASEKPVTDDTDEIADVYVFRPLGIWLLHDAGRARLVRDGLGMVDWPYLAMWDVDDREFTNVGMNYALRPTWFGCDDVRPFAHIGITNVFGLSHRVSAAGDRVSWGAGVATVTVDPVELRWSAGLFWDRDGGLLASLIGNGADGYAVRVNLYPGALFAADVPLGVFAGVRDDGELTAGVMFGLPVGAA